MSAAPTTINFTLNGRPVSADVKPHHNVVEVLQTQFAYSARAKVAGRACAAAARCWWTGGRCRAVFISRFFSTAPRSSRSSIWLHPGKLDPVQQAFIECGAFQCGYCTPGFVMMTKALIGQYPDPDDEQIRDYLSGNLCRCAAYPEIVNAVKMAARNSKPGSTG